jgi:hypothetical protein
LFIAANLKKELLVCFDEELPYCLQTGNDVTPICPLDGVTAQK